MKCPLCSSKTKVLFQKHKEQYRRRRECNKCDYRFTTMEVTASDVLDILDEHLKEYELNKIMDDLDKIYAPKIGRPIKESIY